MIHHLDNQKVKSLGKAMSRRIFVLSIIGITGIFSTMTLGMATTLLYVQDEMETAVGTAREEFDTFFNIIKTDLLATSEGLSTGADIRLGLLGLHSRNKAVRDTLFISKNGSLFSLHAASRENQLQKIKKIWPDLPSPGYRSVSISRVYFDTSTPFLFMAASVTDELSLPDGILVAEVDLADLWNRALNINIHNTGYVAITDENGQLIAFNNRSLLEPGNHLETLIGITPEQISNNRLNLYHGLTGEIVLAAAQQLRAVPWYAIVEQPIYDAMSIFFFPATLLFIIIFIVVLLLVNSIHFTRSRIVVPLTLLREAVSKMADGALDQTVECSYNDEFCLFANSFSSMSQQLKQAFIDKETQITALKETHDALKESETIFDSFMEHSPIFIFFKDRNIRSIRLSRNFEKMLGMPVEQALGKTMYELFPSELAKKIVADDLKILNKGERVDVVEELDGRIYRTIKFPILKDGKPYMLAGFTTDITEQIKSEEALKASEIRLRQSEKMEAIGQLSGGIAHDFNNILGGIIGFTELSLELVDEDSLVFTYLNKILDGSERARQLVEHILTFSRKNPIHKSAIELQPVINEALELLRASVPSSVNITTDLNGAGGYVHANPTNIHEIILNIATNAVHAMNRKGELKVALRRENIKQPQQGIIGEIKPNEYMIMEIIDTGCGMDRNTLSHIFEPFFTTKKTGEGTGMGLSVVLGVIQSHDGDLQIESIPGEGTTFRLFLAVCPPPQENNIDLPEKETINGSGHIILVDDEEVLIDSGTHLLEGLGYTVTSFASSRAALDYIINNADSVDLLLTDQTMPGLTGLELAGEFLKIRPDVPIVISSGYSSDLDHKKAFAIGITDFIMKPFRMRELGSLLKKILDKRGPDDPQLLQ